MVGDGECFRQKGIMDMKQMLAERRDEFFKGRRSIFVIASTDGSAADIRRAVFRKIPEGKGVLVWVDRREAEEWLAASKLPGSCVAELWYADMKRQVDELQPVERAGYRLEWRYSPRAE